jgi:hypothetical protein
LQKNQSVGVIIESGVDGTRTRRVRRGLTTHNLLRDRQELKEIDDWFVGIGPKKRSLFNQSQFLLLKQLLPVYLCEKVDDYERQYLDNDVISADERALGKFASS